MSRKSKISVAYQDKMYYGLRTVIVGAKQVGKKTIIRQLVQSTGQRENLENRIILSDKVLNVDYVFDFIVNPTNLTSYEEEFAQHINPNFQFTLLIGNKQDFEEYREVSSSEAEKFASENQMVFFETSAENNRNIDYVEKLLRVRSAQTMKKYNIKPTPIPPTSMIQEEQQESQTQTELDADSLDAGLQSETQQQFSQHSSPQDSQQAQSPIQSEDEDDNSSPSLLIAKLNNDEHRPLPSPPKSSERKNIISDIASKPIKSNLSAKFKSVQGNSSKQSSPERQEEPKKNPLYQIYEDCLEAVKPVDIEIDKTIHELDQINQILKTQRKYCDRMKVLTRPIYQPIIDRKNNSLANEFNQIEHHESDPFSSRRRSPFLMSARMTTPEIEQIMNKTTLFDTRRYSRKYKPLMFIFFTFEDKLFSKSLSVEVHSDDTASTVAERLMPKLRSLISSSLKGKRRITTRIEHEVALLNEELEKQRLLIEKKRLRLEDAMNNYILKKNQQLQESLGATIQKNNWSNPTNAIAKIVVHVGSESKLLYIHPQDDPHELAFYFLLENELEKSKVTLLAEQISQYLKQESNRHQVTERSSAISNHANKYAFQGNFDCGNGVVLPLFIKKDESAEKQIYHFVCQNNLKFEQYQKIRQIVTKSLNT